VHVEEECCGSVSAQGILRKRPPSLQGVAVQCPQTVVMWWNTELAGGGENKSKLSGPGPLWVDYHGLSHEKTAQTCINGQTKHL